MNIPPGRLRLRWVVGTMVVAITLLCSSCYRNKGMETLMHQSSIYTHQTLFHLYLLPYIVIHLLMYLCLLLWKYFISLLYQKESCAFFNPSSPDNSLIYSRSSRYVQGRILVRKDLLPSSSERNLQEGLRHSHLPLRPVPELPPEWRAGLLLLPGATGEGRQVLRQRRHRRVPGGLRGHLQKPADAQQGAEERRGGDVRVHQPESAELC